MATEEIAHSIVSSEGDIEIRQYDETIKAVVTVEAKRREASNKAFRVLFDYISGENIAQQEIPMTTPVAQEPASQKIPMTTPVAQGQAGEGKWEIAFYMPNDMSYEATPQPTDKRIEIQRVPAKKMAAIRFSGLGSDKAIQEYEAELVEYLKTNQIDYVPIPTYAFYDAPWVPWFMRRNEVLFELKE